MDVFTPETVYQGRNAEEALHAALAAAGLTEKEARITVLDRGSRGFLGIGSRRAQVRVEPRAGSTSAVRAMTVEVLRLMGIDARVVATQKGRTVHVAIESGKSDGLLIGRKGETLQALQHVISRMAQRQTALGTAARVVVDVSGYRLRREEQLCRMAVQLAERVERTGRRAMTEPLDTEERRLVHRALEGVKVETHAAGNGPARRVVITPIRRRRPTAER